MGFLDHSKQTKAGPSPHHIDLHHRAKWLVNNGVEAPAHIDAMASTGITDRIGGTEYMIKLTVSPAGSDAYTVTTNHYVYPSAPLSEGEDVTVKVDPGNRAVVMISRDVYSEPGFAGIPV